MLGSEWMQEYDTHLTELLLFSARFDFQTQGHFLEIHLNSTSLSPMAEYSPCTRGGNISFLCCHQTCHKYADLVLFLLALVMLQFNDDSCLNSLSPLFLLCPRIWRRCFLSPHILGSFCTQSCMPARRSCCSASSLPSSRTLCTTGRTIRASALHAAAHCV